jgi:flavin reductase (DIM6/NTAB) family NADH-FMN oxidoreductase RutF
MKNWKTILPEEAEVPAFHSFMLAAVGPRPIAFVSTIDAHGRPNLAPFSFFNAFGSNPPILVFSPARRGRENTVKHTLENVEEVPQCVVNMVNFSMVEQMNLASTEFDKGVNEFEKAGFTALTSEKVKPPRVAEAPASFECEVINIIKTGDMGGAGNLVVSKVLALHFDSAMVLENGKIDQAAMDLVGRMGYDFYCRASKESIFELPKPKSKEVIGFDGLPEKVRESEIFTGAQLSRLANSLAIPEVDEPFLQKFSQILTHQTFSEILLLARQLILDNDIESAWKAINFALSKENNT